MKLNITLEEFKAQRETLAMDLYKTIALKQLTINELLFAAAASYVVFKDQGITNTITTSDGFNIYED